jgi:hypothetical protein
LCIYLRMADPEWEKDREKVLLLNSIILVEMVKTVIDCLADGISLIKRLIGNALRLD